MVKKSPGKLVQPKEERPGRRWGAGLASIMDLLGTPRRTIEDDTTWFAELKADSGKKGGKGSDRG
jgi:hypothetical protein